MTKIITDKKLMAAKFINGKVFTGKLFNIVKSWKQNRSSRTWQVPVHLGDFLWFCLVLGGSGQFRTILWFILFIWFIFSTYIRTI